MFQDSNAKTSQDRFKGKNVIAYQENNVIMFLGSNARLFQDSNATPYQEQYQDKNARMFPGNNVKMFPVNNAKMFQGKNAEMFQDRFKETNAETSPDNSAIMFPASNVKMFPGNNVETCHDKFANKLVMVVNSFLQTVEKNAEQSLVIITSPISIMLYQTYVIFILMSTFRLKHNLVN